MTMSASAPLSADHATNVVPKRIPVIVELAEAIGFMSILQGAGHLHTPVASASVAADPIQAALSTQQDIYSMQYEFK